MPTLTLQIPDDVQAAFTGRGADSAASFCLAAAYSLCQRGRLSTSQAARLAGMTYSEFLAAAAVDQVELFPATPNELAQEINYGFNMGR